MIKPRWTAIALLLVAAFAADTALAATRGPEAFFRKYIQRPIEEAARALQPIGPTTKKKSKSVAPASLVTIVPKPRRKPSVEAGAEANLLPTVISAEAGAALEPALAGGAAAETTPATEPDKKIVTAMVVPKPRLAPAKPDVKLASLPPSATTEAPGPANPALLALGVLSKPLTPIIDHDCAIADPVAVASLESGAVKLSEKATLNHALTETLALWVHDDVAPAARRIFKDDLTSLRVLASYDCRTVDHIEGAKLSEHAFGNAIDIGAFRIGKRWIAVGDKTNTDDDEKFLKEVRLAACDRFSTVLGPGQPLHDTHFHLDLRKHGKSGRYKICQ